MPLTILAAVLALGACGEEDKPAAGGRPAETKAREAALKFARCMREQGIDMPDPKVAEGGGTVFRSGGQGEGVPDAKLREADARCRKHLEAMKPPELSKAEQQEFKDKALAHARCMREQGIDFPDPTFGEHGRVQMRLERGSGVDPSSPAFQRAQKTCADKLGMTMGVAPRPAGGGS